MFETLIWFQWLDNPAVYDETDSNPQTRDKKDKLKSIVVESIIVIPR